MAKQRKQRRKRKLENDVDEELEVKKEPKLEVTEVEMETESEEAIGVNTILPTREMFADQLLVLLKTDHLVIIDGDVGCGKTFLAKHAASRLNLPVRVMQMGDQLDSKSLLGSYDCTEVAGNFKWKKSSFHEWLVTPGVILIEDIDTGNADVVTSLLGVASSRRMILPTGEPVHLDPHCRFIATTQSTRLGARRNGLLEGVFSRISLPSISDDELKRLGKTIYPRISHIVNPICKIFRELESMPRGGNSRKLTSSDAMRAFHRANSVENPASSQAILLELLDVWCICEPTKERRELICTRMAGLLSLTKDEVEFSMKMRTPSLSVSESTVSVGRVSLERKNIVSMERTTRLGQTKGALQLLERMAMSVSMEEAVLLVGESGVGKTSLVQVLADMRGEKLATVNLGPHTDTDDLITSLRPTSYGRLIEPFSRDFSTLFAKSFDASKNEKFLHNLEVYLMHNKFDEYLRVIEETARRILSKKRNSEWASMVVRCRRLREGMEKGATPFALKRGIVREAADEGYWLLVDEINLATPECLDAIVDAISSAHHPSFRLFACMNPATDTAKRRLPEGIRSRFTEYYVAEDADKADLIKIVSSYLPSSSVESIESIVKLYMAAKEMYPHKLSLRSLTRALLFAGDGRFDSEKRCLYEAFSMAFLSNMEKEEKDGMAKMIKRAFPCEKKGTMRREKEDSIMIEGYEIERGEMIPQEEKGYIITPTVRENLAEVARIVSSKRLSVLLEGETSAGKTSIVTHLAKITGNVVRRINNHEQTDVQEYLGSYVPDSNGRLYFREGLLVEAVRKGYWVILDELNLAPSDVIETLNRLLDDNRELFISESNEVIKAHPRFRLFATQNPAGSYAGRKRLSRALLSRFVVLQFPVLPLKELSQMVCARCEIAPSAAEKMIRVLIELRLQRSMSGLFSAKDGLMTLRDVFRWGNRLATDEGEDWMAALIHHGYFLLAGRCRNDNDKKAVVTTLQTVLKGKIDEEFLFSVDSPYFPRHLCFDQVILTLNMRRMLVLSYQALLRHEAVLVVGETGDGKTRLAQTIGGEKMMTINCHERTECSDLLGRLRPDSSGGFEWQDGVVVSAMREGRVLLMDEISLAEDSVLERLNPLFEEKRTIVLTDSGAEAEEVRADDGFKVIATMNPGGDYGKKELSKALRNRFTEIWSSSSFDRSELVKIFEMRVKDIESIDIQKAATVVIEWIDEFYKKNAHALRVTPSVRDIVACADMWSSLCLNGIEKERALIETVSSVFIDGIPCQMTRTMSNIKEIQEEGMQLLLSLVSPSSPSTSSTYRSLSSSSSHLSMGDLSLPFGSIEKRKPKGFSLNAPTCMENMYRVMRALYINKPILLEGSPGCGKSTLIMALASIAGYPITRLNLSEQTDLSDLFGADVPIVNEEGKMSFEWKDGPILKAIKNGEWILLDEMNLASQSILEGLNACFDHRRVLYIAELAREFEIPSSSPCRFFACQNPRGEGGNRRALPKSFVNRFTNIYTADLNDEDELAIVREMKGEIEERVMEGMVKVNRAMSAEQWTAGPFSFNLRDMNRWMEMIRKTRDIGYSFETLYVNRLRVEKERGRAREILREIMGVESHSVPAIISIDEKTARIGPLQIERRSPLIPSSLHPLSSQSWSLLSLLNCLSHGWIPLLIGPINGGKRSMAEMAASIMGVELEVISLSSDTDASELIGTFEQKVDEEGLTRLVDSLSSILSPLVDGVEELREMKELEKIEGRVELMLTTEGIPQTVVDEVKGLLIASQRSEMYFEWIDSAFVRAYTEGKCILIENVNQCNSAVLDRLNCALESGGSLVMSESRGDFQPIYPHKEFRVILSMDSLEGEISRAMRNRSVEMWMGEGRGWNEEMRDVKTVLENLSGKETVTGQFASALTSLPFRSILFSGLVLNQYDEDYVAKLMNRCIDDEMSDVSPSVESVGVPPLSEWMDRERVGEWMGSLWMEGKGEEKRAAIPLLPLLAASGEMMKTEGWKRRMGDRGMALVQALSPLLPSTSSSHPIDPTFHGDRTVEPNHKLIISALFHWLSLLSSEMEKEKESALHMAKTMSIYEMTSSPFYFPQMEGSRRMMAGMMEELKKKVDGGRVESKSMFPLCLCLLSLLRSLSQRMSIRSGDTRIRIAYEELIRSCEKSMGVFFPRISEWAVDGSIEEFIQYYNEESLVHPFEEKEKIEQMREGVRRLREMGETEEGEESSFFSSVSTVGRRIGKMISMNGGVHHIMCMNTLDNGWMRVIGTMGWKSEESARGSVIGSILSSDLMERLPSTALIFNSPVSVLLSMVWHKLGWDPAMRCITVRNLRDLSLDSFVAQLWRIGANSRIIQRTIRSAVREMGGGEDRSSSSLLSYGLDGMKRGLPPSFSLDPVVYREEKEGLEEEKRRVVEEMIETLEGWRRRMGGEGCKVDEESTHPFLRSLYECRDRLREEREKMERGGEKRKAYREDSKQYSVLLREMQSLFKLCSTLYGLIGGEKWKEEEEIELMRSHVVSALASTKMFLQDSLLRFGSLIDVMGGYWNGVWIVHLALNIIHYQMSLHSARLSLISTTAAPRRVEEGRVSWMGPIRNSMVEWSIRASSPLSLDLQSAIVEWRVERGEGGMVEMEWIRSQWQKWYDKNVEKENKKEFEYRDKSMEEKEEKELEEMFDGLDREEGIVGEENLLRVLEAFMRGGKAEDKPFEGKKRLVTAMAQLKSICGEMGVEEKWMNGGLDASLYAFTSLDGGAGRVIDVYRETSWNEVKEAVEECEKLRRKTEELREKWPEVQSLSLTLDSIESFMESSLSIGQMRMAEKLEKIIEEAEKWEELADRAHSLDGELYPLRERLVGWKKMEILSWNRLVDRVKRDCEERSALVAYPLFDGVVKEDGDGSSLVAMAADWISHSSFLDFAARMKSVLCMAEWADRREKREMGGRLRRVVEYYGQFREKVEGQLKGIVDEVERSMKDLVRIAQYKDLNLLSIKASSKKNHMQLFKMVRRLKRDGGIEMSGVMDGLMSIERWKRMEEEEEREEEKEEGEEGIVRRAREIGREIEEKRKERMGEEKWRELGEQIEETRAGVEKRVEYKGDEKEMESEQGRERNGRQRGVALVIKECQSVGINGRRGMTLNGEEISRKGLSEIGEGEEKRKKIVRALALARSILIRRAMKPNEQLSTATRGHLLGMVEYGTHWMIENEEKIDEWKRMEKEMERMEGWMKNEEENGQEIDGPRLNHCEMRERMEWMGEKWREIDGIMKGLKMRMKNVPEKSDEESDGWWSPLSRLTSTSEEMGRIGKMIEEMENGMDRMKGEMEKIERDGEMGVYTRSLITSSFTLMGEIGGEMKKRLNEMEYWFDEESQMMRERIGEMEKRIETLPVVEDSEVFSLPTEPLLLFIQRLYKNSVEKEEEWEGLKEIDVIGMSAKTIGEARGAELISFLSDALTRISTGDRMKNLPTISRLFSIARQILRSCVSRHERCCHSVGVVLHSLAELGVQLMEKGYVNTIPKEEKREEGEGKEMEGEGGGMGEGKGEKDVTEEMEETGQIEGLRGEEEEEEEGGKGEGEKNERPIEMEEDFAKDLEDVDRDQESGEEEGEEEGENEMDDGMGEVDEKEEEEIDPHLWDEDEKEKKDERDRRDDDNKGADEETGEMGAREDEMAETREEEEKEGEKGEEGGEEKEEEKGEEKEDEDMENMDKNDRENQEELEGKEGEEEKKGEEGKEDEEMEMGEEPVDANEEEEDGEGEEGEKEEGEEEEGEEKEGDEEKEEEEGGISEQMTEEIENGEEKEEEKKEEKKMDSGYGGEKNEEEKEEGGGAEREEEEEEGEDKEEKGENGNEDDNRKKEGKKSEKGGDKEKKKEKEEGEEEEEEGEKEERKREIVVEDDREVEEEMDTVEGEKDEMGEEREESRERMESDRMMSGAGSLEEAKESMKRRENKQLEKKKEKIEVSGMEVLDETEEGEGKETMINFNKMDLLQLTEQLTESLVMGGRKEEEVEMKEERMEEKKEEEGERYRLEWERIAPVVSLLSAELAENLRLILEPRLATRMEGDYRSGKRLNMKRIIPYIASQYRKNRIWMRRTKKAERSYEVLIAVDDSASMGENGMETLTCQGVCIVEEALRRVNAGQISVITFGEKINQIVPFTHSASTQSTGESLLSSLTFNQSSTDMAGMLDRASDILEEIATAKSEQMLIIISDGRGALANGVEKIRRSLARLSRVSVLFLILDSGKKSIKEMKVASFVNDQVELIPYLSLFPFPLYVLAQSANHIPSLLAEGIRQWIEYGTNQ